MSWLRSKAPAWRGWCVHSIRIGLFVTILGMLHLKHRQFLREHRTDDLSRLTIEQATEIFPQATHLIPSVEITDAIDVLDAADKPIGHLLQTSPAGDASIGFSGPTNALIACDEKLVIRAVRILSSRDTREHVARVKNDAHFWTAFQDLTLTQAAQQTHVDAVSGATLTSDAIATAILRRLGGSQASLKFTEAITVADLKSLFPEIAIVEVDAGEPSVIHALDAQHHPLGWALRTSPAADNIVGYQGPTDTLLAFDPHGHVIGLAIKKSFDNEPYVGYVRDDAHFQQCFQGQTLEQMATLDLAKAKVEGVSGATMSSLAIAQGLIAAAKQQRDHSTPAPQSWLKACTATDYGVFAIILIGVVFGLSRWRGKRLLRVLFALLVIGYLGFFAGTLLSQAQIVGWAQSGVSHGAAGLLALAAAALFLPTITRRNLYCSHLCPHGAAQQLIQIAIRPQRTIPRPWRSLFGFLPVVLLGFCLVVGLTHAPIGLVDLEPFDAYIWRVAGKWTLGIAAAGLLASCFVPLAYCRYGCPTGALLEFLRRYGRSDQFTGRDKLALVFLGTAYLFWKFL